jgi:hypothetical protein
VSWYLELTTRRRWFAVDPPGGGRTFHAWSRKSARFTEEAAYGRFESWRRRFSPAPPSVSAELDREVAAAGGVAPTARGAPT